MEKLSLKKQLKLKCQEQNLNSSVHEKVLVRIDTNSDFHHPLLSYAQPGKKQIFHCFYIIYPVSFHEINPVVFLSEPGRIGGLMHNHKKNDFRVPWQCYQFDIFFTVVISLNEVLHQLFTQSKIQNLTCYTSSFLFGFSSNTSFNGLFLFGKR